MKAAGAIVCFLLGFGAIVLVQSTSRPVEDPEYQGRRLSEYLEELKLEGPIEESPRSYVAEALRHFDKDALPLLREMLSTRESFIRRTLHGWSDRVPLLAGVHYRPAREPRRLALLACHYLRCSASEAVPEMLELLEMEQCSRDAAIALSVTGSATIPKLIERLGDRRAFVRANAALALGEMRMTPDIESAVPALEQILSDPASNARRESARALEVISVGSRRSSGVGQFQTMPSMALRETAP